MKALCCLHAQERTTSLLQRGGLTFPSYFGPLVLCTDPYRDRSNWISCLSITFAFLFQTEFDSGYHALKLKGRLRRQFLLL